MKLIICFALLLVFKPYCASAHPTSYEGGYALMSEMRGGSSELSLIYSPKFWLGVGVVSVRSKGEYKILTSQIGWLVNRWNLPAAQGNIYLIGGIGTGDLINPTGVVNSSGAIYRYGAQADYETRRIFTFLRYVEHRFIDSGQLVSDHFSAAVGFAPYLAEFNELNIWVILKAMYNSRSKEPVYVPTVRFFYKNFLWELGQDFNGNSQFNFMVRF